MSVAYLAAFVVPVIVGGLAAYLSTFRLTERVNLRLLTPAEKYAQQKELSSWIVRTVSQLDPQHPSKEEIRHLLTALQVLHASSAYANSNLINSVFSNTLTRAGRALEEDVESFTDDRYIVALQKLIDLQTEAILKLQGAATTSNLYYPTIRMNRLRLEFEALHAEYTRQQIQGWKNQTQKGYDFP